MVLERGPALVEALAADALSSGSPALGQAVALHLLRALLVVDAPHVSTTHASSSASAAAVVAAAAYGNGVPQQLLSQLAAMPAAALTGLGKRARRSVHVVEAALALLAALAAAGPPAARAAAAQQLYSLNCLGALNRWGVGVGLRQGSRWCFRGSPARGDK